MTILFRLFKWSYLLFSLLASLRTLCTIFFQCYVILIKAFADCWIFSGEIADGDSSWFHSELNFFDDTFYETWASADITLPGLVTFSVTKFLACHLIHENGFYRRMDFTLSIHEVCGTSFVKYLSFRSFCTKHDILHPWIKFFTYRRGCLFCWICWFFGW